MSDILDYKCPACGGAIAFDADTQQMKCPYCDTLIDVEQLKSKDEVLDDDIDPNEIPNDEFSWDSEQSEFTDDESNGLFVFVCDSCGGQIVGDSNTASTKCPYCGNNVVIKERFTGQLKPDFVIPFKINIDQAKERYYSHINHKFFLPKEFRSKNHIDEIKGIYVPFWLYSSHVSSFARFLTHRERTWTSGKFIYTEHTSYDCYREGKMNFENIPVDGSKAIDNILMESIEPFDFSDAVPFQTAYLAGFYADKYDVSGQENEVLANERIRESTIQKFRETVVGYNQVNLWNRFEIGKGNNSFEYDPSYKDSFSDSNTSSSGVKMIEGNIKYAMYPIYLLSSTYNGQKFIFAMNGQTGKFVGNLPCDKKKAFLTLLISFLASSIVSTVIIEIISRLLF